MERQGRQIFGSAQRPGCAGIGKASSIPAVANIFIDGKALNG